uniref:NADH-ubiquinone oxidoreductase chain 3 n=1 Tax=Megaspilidae sp. SJW-2015 TaxID=1738630 RepID=A0A342I4F7_9HYME|nr:NADH dehydrogenase subunit 3 [Megaspilidae sp. SJW-2015]
MFLMNLMLLMILLIILILFLISYFFKKKMNTNFQKLSPFECGFQQITSASTSVSIPFFLITLIFLIFDIEITILFPILDSIITLNKLNLIMKSFIMFFLILIIGLFLEWMNSAIEWLK